jgi:hypothetical protein
MMAIMLLVLGMDGNTIFRTERHRPVMMSNNLSMMYKKNEKIFVSNQPIVYSFNKKYDGSLKDLIKLEYKTTPDSLNIL